MESSDAGTSTAARDRVHEMRASLATRREIEDLLAQASAARHAAATDAEMILEEAQNLAEQLLEESRAEADQVSVESRERAVGIVSRARGEAEEVTHQARTAADSARSRAAAEVEDHRRRVRAEVTDQVIREVAEQNRSDLIAVYEHQQAMIGDVEASVRILGVSLDSAVSNVGELLAALDTLRAHNSEALRDTTDTTDTTDTANTADTTHLEAQVAVPGHREMAPPLPAQPSTPQPSTAEPSISQPSVLDASVPLDQVDWAEPPRSATEAYLRSAHLEHDDPVPPLEPDQPVDEAADEPVESADPDVSDPAERSDWTIDTAVSTTAIEDPTPDGEEPDDQSKPLGWLFRNP